MIKKSSSDSGDNLAGNPEQGPVSDDDSPTGNNGAGTNRPAVPKATTKAEITRQRILSAALTLFREKGFDETTMRDIAAAADISTGAAYYYFASKDDLAMQFYMDIAQESRSVIPQEIARTRDLSKRLHYIIVQKLEQLSGHRRFMVSLFRTAVDPGSPVSPFASQTRALRDEAIGWFELALRDSNTAIPKEFRAGLPKLLWLYQMGTVLFWVYDRSPGQQRTYRLVDGTIGLMVQGLKLSSLPLMGGIRRKMATLMQDLDLDDGVDTKKFITGKGISHE